MVPNAKARTSYDSPCNDKFPANAENNARRPLDWTNMKLGFWTKIICATQLSCDVLQSVTSDRDA